MRLRHFVARVRAMLALRRVYDHDLAEIAHAVIEARRQGEASLMDLTRQQVAQHPRARSATAALETLLVSLEHRDAWETHTGPGVRDTFAARAYWTLLADVRDELRKRGEVAMDITP